MTMRNYVQCVQRSVQDSNPLSVTNLHTLQNWYRTHGVYGTVIVFYPLVDTSYKKTSPRLRLNVLTFPEPYGLVPLSTQFRLRIQQARSLEKPTLELQITPQFCVSDRLAIIHRCDSATTHSSWGQPVYSFPPKWLSSSALSFVTGVDFSSNIPILFVWVQGNPLERFVTNNVLHQIVPSLLKTKIHHVVDTALIAKSMVTD